MDLSIVLYRDGHTNLGCTPASSANRMYLILKLCIRGSGMILFLVINTSTMEYRFTIKLIYENLLLYVSCNNEYRVLYFYPF